MAEEFEGVVLYELVDRPDGTIGIGNSIEVSRPEAELMIRNRQAKHESAPIGEFPGEWVVVEAGVKANERN